MKLKIESWDGELAIRLPEWLVDKYGIKVGDPFDWSGVDAEMSRQADARIVEPRHGDRRG